ncbi:MAG: hypothetical protein U0Z44_09300 [Kouleothrix sp.]
MQPWQRGLAYGFWHDQLAILLAAGWRRQVCWAGCSACSSARRERNLEPATRNLELGAAPGSTLPAIYYTAVGAVVAYGVGKVGAYANYFLELYAGLIWLAAIATRLRGYRLVELRPCWCWWPAHSYYPTWSRNLPEAGRDHRGPQPAAPGARPLWRVARSAARARDPGRVCRHKRRAERPGAGGRRADLHRRAGRSGTQAGQLARLQAFEYRQLLDAGLADQRGLLRDLANGRVPLVVLDYLGNWLTPEMITLVTHRYAQGWLARHLRPVPAGQAWPGSAGRPGVFPQACGWLAGTWPSLSQPATTLARW